LTKNFSDIIYSSYDDNESKRLDNFLFRSAKRWTEITHFRFELDILYNCAFVISEKSGFHGSIVLAA